jgi:hypothetical protein
MSGEGFLFRVWRKREASILADLKVERAGSTVKVIPCGLQTCAGMDR